MCTKFVLASDLSKIETRFNVRFDPGTVEISRLYSVSCADYSYVITSENPNVLQVFKFGMTPFFSTEPQNLINARAEGDKNSRDDPNYNGSKAIFLQAPFKKPIQSQRCLVIADAYYEWSGQQKPCLVYLQDKNRPFAFASIYDRWIDPVSRDIFFSFSIITTVSNSLLQSIGVKRMPVILSKSDESHWVKSSNHLSDVLRLLAPYPSERMNAYPVSEMVNIPGMNDPSMLNPVGAKLQTESNPVRISGGYHPHKEKPQSGVSWFDNK